MQGQHSSRTEAVKLSSSEPSHFVFFGTQLLLTATSRREHIKHVVKADVYVNPLRPPPTIDANSPALH